MYQGRVNEIKGILFFFLGIILLVSLISYTPEDIGVYTSHPNRPPKNLIGIFGANLAYLCFFLIGYSSYLLPLHFFVLGINKFKNKTIKLKSSKVIGILGFLLSLSAFFSLFPATEQIRDIFINSKSKQEAVLKRDKLFQDYRHIDNIHFKRI